MVTGSAGSHGGYILLVGSVAAFRVGATYDELQYIAGIMTGQIEQDGEGQPPLSRCPALVTFWSQR